MGFLKTETYPLIYSSSDIPEGKLPGDIISILSFDITIFIFAFISHNLWAIAFATESLKASFEIYRIYNKFTFLINKKGAIS